MRPLYTSSLKTPLLFALCAVALVLAVATPAAAQAGAGNSVEITPFAGYRFGGDFSTYDNYDDEFVDTGVEISDGSSFGLTVDLKMTRNLYLELLFSRQSTDLSQGGGLFLPNDALFDLDVDYYHAGVLYQWRPGQVQPFFVATLGATRFSPSGGGLSDESRFSGAIGGGVKIYLNDNVGVRLDGRVLATSIDDGRDAFCGSRRYCYRYDNSTYLTQSELSAGVIFSF